MRPVFVFGLLALIACTQPRSKTCREICKREADCIDQTGNKIPFDEKECVAACGVLEGDSENVAKVVQHHACVQRKQSCAEILECQ